MYPLTSHFAASSSGLGALGFSGSAFVIQLITFILTFLVLRRFAFKPILKIMNERKATIEQGVKLGEQMKKDKQKQDESIQEQLAEARTKADQIIAAAEDSARDTVREAEQKAGQKADQIIAEAKMKTEQDLDRAKRKLEGEIIGLVAEATEALTGEKIDAKKDSKLIDKALEGKA